MSIFMDPFNFCDLASFLFCLKAKGSVTEKGASVSLSLCLSDVSLEEHKKYTYTRLRTKGRTLQ